MDVLIRIKRAVLAGRYAFSEKARLEMETDDLTELDVAESILNAVCDLQETSLKQSFTKQPTGIPLCDSEYKFRWLGNIHKRKASSGGRNRNLLLLGFL